MDYQWSFLDEWQTLFGRSSPEFRKHCIRGHLRNSHLLRSIVWRVLLRILPEDKANWIKHIERARQEYTDLRNQMESNPRIVDSGKMNLDANNPLSLNTESPWYKYFENQALRKNIEKDVDRTCPDLKFFQVDDVKQTMVNVLFFYSKVNPQISYIQGMHELLGPILFALDSDQKAFQDMKAQNILKPKGNQLSEMDVQSLGVINDPAFLEHDAFAMFTQLMSMINCFYRSDGSSFSAQTNSSAFMSHFEKAPFSENEFEKSSELLRLLEYIHDELLPAIDPSLYQHLNDLKILPQIYGVRWLRLLFGREFPLPDLLYLWDVILAEYHQHHTLEIVYCIFVALLVQIRNVLLNSDYSACIHCLMRYPPIADIQTFIHYILHLTAPKKLCGSLENVHKAYQTHLSLAANTQTNTTNPRRIPTTGQPAEFSKRNKSPVQRSMSIKARQLENVFNKFGRQALTSAHNFHFNNLTRKEYKCQNNRVIGEPFSKSANSTDCESVEVAQRQSTDNVDEIELMKEQIAQLQSRLNESDLLKQICTNNISSLIKEIEKVGPFTAEQHKKINEIREIVEQLQRSSVPEQLILRFVHAPPSTSATGSVKSEREPIEIASEMLGFRPSTPSETVNRSRLSSNSLNNNNELVELRFDRKKNF